MKWRIHFWWAKKALFGQVAGTWKFLNSVGGLGYKKGENHDSYDECNIYIVKKCKTSKLADEQTIKICWYMKKINKININICH